MTDTYITFNGANASVEDTPEFQLGDRVEFTGFGECTRIGIKVAEVDLGDISPAEADPQLQLGDDDKAQV